MFSLVYLLVAFVASALSALVFLPWILRHAYSRGLYTLRGDERGDRIVCEQGVSNCAMIFYYNAGGISDVTTFTYEYTIKGVITEYGDISELNWVMLGDQPMNVENIEIKVKTSGIVSH